MLQPVEIVAVVFSIAAVWLLRDELDRRGWAYTVIEGHGPRRLIRSIDAIVGKWPALGGPDAPRSVAFV